MYINPKFEEFIITTSWENSRNKNWWGKELQVFIRDDTPEGKLRTRQDGASVGEVFYVLACSPLFAKSPNSEVTVQDIKKALILDSYDDDAVTKYLVEKINTIGTVTIKDFETKFSALFDMTDWLSD